MKYRRFEEIPVWQETRKFVKRIYDLIEESPKLRRDFSLCDQLKRAVYSILLNIAEGFERGSNREFANFLNIAKGSAGEVRSILYIMLDNRYISNEVFVELCGRVERVSAQLSYFRSFLLKKPDYKK